MFAGKAGELADAALTPLHVDVLARLSRATLDVIGLAGASFAIAPRDAH